MKGIAEKNFAELTLHRCHFYSHNNLFPFWHIFYHVPFKSAQQVRLKSLLEVL